MNFKLMAAGAALMLAAVACKTGDGFNETESGIQYTIHNDSENAQIKEGDIVTLHMVTKTATDSVLSSTYMMGQPITLQASKPQYKGDLMEGLLLLSEGDSATLMVVADSLLRGQPLPPFLKSGDMLKYDVKVMKVTTEAAMKKEEGERVGKEAAEIENYAKQKNLDVQKTASGLYYVIETPGTGANVKAGDTAVVHYRGTLLNGTPFDNSYDRGQPFDVVVGRGQVIPGWDEGLQLFNKGSKGKLLIPSPMAYGSRGMGGNIPPNSILVFDIEMVDIK